MASTVTLMSLDNQPVVFSRKAALLSVTVKELLEDLGDIATEIPIKVKASVLQKVLEWAEHSKDKFDEKKEEQSGEERKLPELDDWERAFFDGLDDDAKVDLILAANLMDIKHLMDVACINVSELVKGQSPDELRKIMERTSKPIPDDLAAGIPGANSAKKNSVLEEEKETSAVKRKHSVDE